MTQTLSDFLSYHVWLVWLLALPALLIALSIYFAPSIVAFSRRKANRVPITVLNLVLGWTILGWVGSLLWASYDKTTEEPFPWRRALKMAFTFASVLFVLCAGVYGYYKYDTWKAEKQHKAKVKACIASVSEGTIIFVPTGDEVTNVVKSFCESNPGANIACGIKQDSLGIQTPYSIGDTDSSNPGKICTAEGWKDDPNYVPSNDVTLDFSKSIPLPNKKHEAHTKTPDHWAVVSNVYGATLRKRCAFEANLTGDCLYGSDRVAELKQNDCVQVLSGIVRMASGTDAYQVRFRHWTGWVDSKQLNVLVGGSCPSE